MGLETLYELYKDSARSRLHEAYICFHSFFIEQSLLCLGTTNEDNKGSELLPSGWNNDPNTVELFYVNTVTRAVYKAVALIEGSSCLLHLFSAKPGEEKSAFVEIDINEYINETTQKAIQNVYKNVDRLKKVVKEQLVDLVVSCPVAEGGSATEDRFGKKSTESRERPSAGLGREDWEGPSSQFDPLRDYGRADVDPFYVPPGGLGGPFPGGGGMIFDPFRNIRPRAPDRFSGLIQPIPRGAVPPGARFDPFGPPGTGFPDPDVEKKPDFNDDFYS